MKGFSIIVLVIFALVMCGCTAQQSAQPVKPVAAANVTGQAVQADPLVTAATVTPAPTSTYMYSTARGLKYHEAGFVCTSNDRTDIYDYDKGLVGIWCER